jgi:hypothetical protein
MRLDKAQVLFYIPDSLRMAQHVSWRGILNAPIAQLAEQLTLNQ